VVALLDRAKDACAGLDDCGGLHTADLQSIRDLEKKYGPLSDRAKAHLACGIKGGARGWVETLVSMQADGAALTNTTTITSILHATGLYSIAANRLNVGDVLIIEASGRISTAAATPGNLDFDVRFGSVSVAASQAMALATSQTNISWFLHWVLTVRAVGGGTTANVMHQGWFHSAALTTAFNEIPASAPAVGTGFDSSAAQAVDFRAHWSFASASNTITAHQYYLQLQTSDG
jgi:hypothetical protein